jgi:hypothetical protein
MSSTARALELEMSRIVQALVLAVSLDGADGAAAQGVEKLFNGKDLTGWVWVPAAGNENSKLADVWSIVDGNLHGKGTPVGYIRTEKDYTSYRLKLQVRHLRPGNGGVLLRVQAPDKVWPRSIEAQGKAGALGDLWNIDQFPMQVAAARTNGRHTAREKPEVKEKPLGEWNDYEIVLDGGDLTLTVNGTVQNRAKGCAIMRGKIALQSEGSEYELRNIELTPLPDAGKRKR